MRIVGLTGGIGSGKSTMLKWFEKQGIPCFESDKVGKQLLNSNLKDQVVKRFGSKIYDLKGCLKRKKLSKIVFNNLNALADLNAIVHPAVSLAFKDFKIKNYDASFIINEAAILFESGRYKDCDIVILVIASKELRLERVMRRDNSNRETVLSRMENQWTDEQKNKLSDYVIINESIKKSLSHLKVIYDELM
jgi:dephospho-CoA kinase